MRRVIIVYNPRSSQAKRVRREVLDPSLKLAGTMVGRYEVQPTDVDDNAKQLARILRDGDLVVTAGGDGTSTIGLNGCMLSNKDVTLGVLGYGNFNDMARGFKTKTLEEIMGGKVTKAYPLEAVIDGRHWRYGMSYFTIGMFAESTRLFNRQGTRRILRRKGKPRFFFSILRLAKWYFSHRKGHFLPAMTMDGKPLAPKTTDYMAMNNLTMARVMKGGKFYETKQFLSCTARLGNFGRLMWFMLRSMTKRVPGVVSRQDRLLLQEPGQVEIQAEGEPKLIEVEREILIKKADRPIKVVIN